MLARCKISENNKHNEPSGDFVYTLIMCLLPADRFISIRRGMKIILLIIIFVTYNSAYSQNNDPDQALTNQFSCNLEGFGNGGLFSVNAAGHFHSSGKTVFNFHAGVGLWENGQISFPVELSCYLGKKQIAPEIGTGITFLQYGYVIHTIRLGLAYKPRKSRLVLRAGFTPYSFIDSYGLPEGYNSYGGLSFGYQFK